MVHYIHIDFMRDEMMILRATKRFDKMRNRIGVLHGFCVQDLCIFAYCFCAGGSQKKDSRAREIALFAVTELKIGENYERFETFALL